MHDGIIPDATDDFFTYFLKRAPPSSRGGRGQGMEELRRLREGVMQQRWIPPRIPLTSRFGD